MSRRVTRAKRISVLSRSAAAVLTLLALGGTAFAQAGDSEMLKEKDEAEGKAVQKYMERMQTDEQYQKIIREQKSAPASNDPWGSVRAATTPADAAKPAAKKPSTRTASGSKPAAVVKPAVPATSAAQKGQ